MRALWGKLAARTLDLIFPPRCVGCGRSGEMLCPICRATLQPVVAPICHSCGRPLASGSVCGDCRTAPLGIAGVRSAYRFEGVLRKAIHELKYGDVTALARTLAGLMVDTAGPLRPRVDVALAVPLHPSRQRKRGYNQAELLLDELARLIELPRATGAVQRVRDTPSQVQVGGRAERRANVRGAFLCRDARIRGQRILLLDDVCTTGSTLAACGEALAAAGAASVWGITLARQI